MEFHCVRINSVKLGKRLLDDLLGNFLMSLLAEFKHSGFGLRRDRHDEIAVRAAKSHQALNKPSRIWRYVKTKVARLCHGRRGPSGPLIGFDGLLSWQPHAQLLNSVSTHFFGGHAKLSQS